MSNCSAIATGFPNYKPVIWNMTSSDHKIRLRSQHHYLKLMSVVKVNVTNTKISTTGKYWLLNIHIAWDKIEVKIGPFTETWANKLMGKWLGCNMKCESFNDYKDRTWKSFERLLMCPLKRFCTPQFQGISLHQRRKCLTDCIFWKEICRMWSYTHRDLVATYKYSMSYETAVSHV